MSISYQQGAPEPEHGQRVLTGGGGVRPSDALSNLVVTALENLEKKKTKYGQLVEENVNVLDCQVDRMLSLAEEDMAGVF